MASCRAAFNPDFWRTFRWSNGGIGMDWLDVSGFETPRWYKLDDCCPPSRRARKRNSWSVTRMVVYYLEKTESRLGDPNQTSLHYLSLRSLLSSTVNQRINVCSTLRAVLKSTVYSYQSKIIDAFVKQCESTVANDAFSEVMGTFEWRCKISLL